MSCFSQEFGFFRNHLRGDSVPWVIPKKWSPPITEGFPKKPFNLPLLLEFPGDVAPANLSNLAMLGVTAPQAVATCRHSLLRNPTGETSKRADRLLGHTGYSHGPRAAEISCSNVLHGNPRCGKDVVENTFQKS